MNAVFKILLTKRMKRFARSGRGLYYKITDSVGEMVFYILQNIKLLPAVVDFEKKVIKKILIIRIDRIGDLVLSTPAVRAVRETFPEAQIHLLITEYTRDLVINNPNINKLLVYGRDKIAKDYNLAIVLHPGFRVNLIAFVSGASYRVGYSGWGGGFFLTHKIIDDRSVRVRHEIVSALEVAARIGCFTGNKNPEVSVTEEGERFADGFFQKNQLGEKDLIIILHCGAQQRYVRWKKERFAELADRLTKEKKARVILTASKKEEQLVTEVASLMKEKPLFALGYKLTCLVSIIKRSKLFVGNANGPMHIAAALKIPVVTIFGVVNALDCSGTWGPWGEGHIVICKNLPCPDCHPSDCNTLDCMNLVTVGDVLEAVDRQLYRRR